jgi:peptidoglycan/xylan/chitin deacetylase (PgdA/CDA1 family)
MTGHNKILLTFDVEEFDMPLEYGHNISVPEQMNLGKKGLDAITDLIHTHNVNCTLFTTANFALQYPGDIKALAAKHEIASHTFYHSAFETTHLAESKNTLEQITGQPVYGLRMPRMRTVEMNDVAAAGYRYDSSINPTFLPGRYNNLHLPRKAYTENGMLRLPVSVTPHLRIPLFWLSFKNFPYSIYKMLALQTLKTDGCLSLYFHPWEFTDISHIKIPQYTKRYSGSRLLDRLDKLITDLKKEGEFCTVCSVL